MVGDFYNPNLEKLLALKPDLVLLHSKRGKHWEVQKLLRSAGVESVCVDYTNYDDFLILLDVSGLPERYIKHFNVASVG